MKTLVTQLQGTDKTAITNTIKNINIANDIVDLGNGIIIGTWKSQFRRDPKLFQETKAKFEQVAQKLEELKKLSPDEQEMKLIQECNAAGLSYKDNMDQFLAKWLAKEEVAQRRVEAANNVLKQAQDTAKRGMEDVTKIADQVATLVEQISNASKDQAKGVDQINSAMTQMDKVVQQGAANAEESASASEELSSQAQVLKQTVVQLAAIVGGNQIAYGRPHGLGVAGTLTP